jgi:hypothetical protein
MGFSEIIDLNIRNEDFVFRVKETTSIKRMLKEFARRKGLVCHTYIDFTTSGNDLLKSTATVKDSNMKNGDSLNVIYHKMYLVIEDEDKSILRFVLRPETKIIYLRNQYALEKKIDPTSFKFTNNLNDYIDMNQTVQDYNLKHNDRLLCKRISTMDLNLQDNNSVNENNDGFESSR